MRFAIGLLVISGLALVGCGGSTMLDGKGGADAGAGAGGTSGGGTGGGASGSGGVAGAGGGSSGAAGGGGAAGSPGCCSENTKYDCETYGDSKQCVNGVCKEPPPPGLCWSDQDCGGLGSVCKGGFVCPCDADCSGPDQLGQCTVQPGCCAKDADCTQKPNVPMMCVGGNCEMKPPAGQCWSSKDCSNGTTCSGECVCPCGAMCACGGQMGWCKGSPPPPPPPTACCKSQLDCGVGSVCAMGVCKQSVAGACWADVECAQGKKCNGASICPCGAQCGMAEYPGKCL